MAKRVNVGGAMDYNDFAQGYMQKMVDRPAYCTICGQDTKQPSIHSASDPQDRRMEVHYRKHMSCAQRQHQTYRNNY